MRRGILLFGFWMALVVLCFPTAGGGSEVQPPGNIEDCKDCDCAESEVWQYVSYDANGVPSVNEPTGIRLYEDSKIGDPVTEAKTKVATGTLSYVYASTCLKNNYKDTSEQGKSYKRVQYTSDWWKTCKTATQTTSGSRPVGVKDKSLYEVYKDTPQFPAHPSSCGKQD